MFWCFFGYRATPRAASFFFPELTPAVFLGVTMRLLGAITTTLAALRDFRGISPVESKVLGVSASCDLQDAVRKKTAVGAVREDDLYVDTLQALSRFR